LAGAGESYPAFLVLLIPEAEGDPADVFDDSVVPLGATIADSGAQSFDDRWLPRVNGPGEAAELGDLGVSAMNIEIGELVPDRAAVRVAAGKGEQLPEHFLSLPALLQAT
jgi:hypothetical protein